MQIGHFSIRQEKIILLNLCERSDGAVSVGGVFYIHVEDREILGVDGKVTVPRFG